MDAGLDLGAGESWRDRLADGDGDFAELGYDLIVEEGLAFLQGVKDASGRAFMA